MPTPKGVRYGGRQKGTGNRVLNTRKKIAQTIAQTLAQLDISGKSMAAIQVDGARLLWGLLEQEQAKEKPQQEAIIELTKAAGKLAHDVSPYLYPTHQQIKHAGDENGAPIRFENMSEHQLEMFIKRLER
jgi:hypothetical protein